MQQAAALAAGGESREAPPLEEPEQGERGLHFICLNANIARQFEFVQSTWLNNPKFDGLYTDADPLVAAHRAGADTFTVPARPVRQRVAGLPQFVALRGGGYFFLPGLRALRYLSQLHSLEEDRS
jgi:deferrochelatase/peroxidase EfeB